MKKTKTGIIMAIILALALLVTPLQTVFADEIHFTVEKDGFVYEAWADPDTNKLTSVFLKEYKGTAKEVELPKPQALVYNGKTYSPDGSEFMVGAPMTPATIFPLNQVTKVAIPNGYERIMDSAFINCTALTEIAIAGSVGYFGSDVFSGCVNLVTYYLETNATLSTGDSGNPRIAQSSDGTINPKQVTVYTKDANSNIISYVNKTNEGRKAGEPEILLQKVADPYSMSGVKPGSGIMPSGNTPGTQQKGKDGTALGEGASESVADSFLKKYSSEADPAGTVFAALQLKASKASKSSIKLNWKKAPGAVRFVIYGNKCGKANRYVKQGQTNATSITFKKVSGAKVKKGTYYKFIVVAYNSKGNVVSTSKTVHVATAGGKVGNAKALTVNAKKNKVNLKLKKTFKLKAKAKPASKKLKVKKHRAILFESSNSKVATVNKKGVIKAVGKGTCYVYAYAQNGVCKIIKVTVK